jgi:drug/metabolite transporter (DMT)-like permease
VSFAAQVPATGRARLLLWLVPLLWSSNYIIARLADGVIAPHALALGRWALAALILLPWMGRGLLRQRDALRREWKQLLALGFFGMYICGAWVYVAGRSTTSTNIALIYAATPMAIVAASSLLPTTLLEAALTATPSPSWGALGLVLLAAVLPGVLSYGAYSYLQRQLGASRTAMMLYLAPVYGALLAWLVLGELPGWYHGVGAAMILPSIWLATRR